MSDPDNLILDFTPERVTDDFTIRDGDVDMSRLRAAVRAGARVFVEFSGRGECSIGFLEPVIDEVMALWLDTDGTLTDLHLLERASNLRLLDITGRVGTVPIDLSSLPQLTVFRAPPRPALGSALRNPHVLQVALFGAMPKKALQIDAPLRALTIHAPGASGSLPVLAHPERLEQVNVSSVRSFDAGYFMQFVNLRSLWMMHAKGVTNLQSFAELPRLRWLRLLGVYSEEDWSVLDGVHARQLTANVRPLPPLPLRRVWRARGWNVQTDDEPDEEVLAEYGPVRVLREPESGWAEVRVEDVAEFDAAVERAGGPPSANGQAVQDLTRSLVEAEYGNLPDDEVLYDSEAGMMSVSFADDAKAARIVQQLRTHAPG